MGLYDRIWCACEHTEDINIKLCSEITPQDPDYRICANARLRHPDVGWRQLQRICGQCQARPDWHLGDPLVILPTGRFLVLPTRLSLQGFSSLEDFLRKSGFVSLEHCLYDHEGVELLSYECAEGNGLREASGCWTYKKTKASDMRSDSRGFSAHGPVAPSQTEAPLQAQQRSESGYTSIAGDATPKDEYPPQKASPLARLCRYQIAGIPIHFRSVQLSMHSKTSRPETMSPWFTDRCVQAKVHLVLVYKSCTTTKACEGSSNGDLGA